MSTARTAMSWSSFRAAQSSNGFDSCSKQQGSPEPLAESGRGDDPGLSARRVGLHAARIGGGAAAAAVARSGGEPSLAPIGVDLDDVTAAAELLHRALRQTTFDHEHARPRRARPERDRKMLGVPG